MRVLSCRAASERSKFRARSIAERLSAFLHTGDKGQALVETALVVPLLVMMLTGIFSVGMAMWNEVTLATGVGTAAQYLGIEGNATGTQMTSLADPCQGAFSQLVGAATSLNPANITMQYTLNGANIGPFTGTAANTCVSQATAFAAGGNVTVVASYPCPIGVLGMSIKTWTVNAVASHFIYTN
jgi:Flp pilus assembly protein TadG